MFDIEELPNPLLLLNNLVDGEPILPGYIDGLGDAVEQGLVKAVGVSNFSGEIFLSF